MTRLYHVVIRFTENVSTVGQGNVTLGYRRVLYVDTPIAGANWKYFSTIEIVKLGSALRVSEAPDKIALPNISSSMPDSLELRYGVASLDIHESYSFHKMKKDKAKVKATYENAKSQKEAGAVFPSKTKQHGKKIVRGGKPHGGICKKTNHVFAKKVGATEPCVLNFYRCLCYKQKLVSLNNQPIVVNKLRKRVSVTNEMNFLATRTFYNGKLLSGTEYDNSSFTQCLGQVAKNGDIQTDTSLWYIERVVEGKRFLILPREALDTDTVWIDFTKINLFALRHAIREILHTKLRESPDTFHDFQKILEKYEDLSLTKNTTKTPIPYKDFVDLLISDGVFVPQRHLKLNSEGARNGLAVTKKIDVLDKNGEKTGEIKTVWPNWEKACEKFKNLANKLKLKKERVTRLCQIGVQPETANERTWVKHRNCMKMCRDECPNARAPRGSFQEFPGICFECTLGTMQVTGREEAIDAAPCFVFACQYIETDHTHEPRCSREQNYGREDARLIGCPCRSRIQWIVSSIDQLVFPSF